MPKRPVSEDTYRRAYGQYRDGTATVIQLASSLGVHTATLYARFADMKNGVLSYKRGVQSQEELAEIRRLREEGWPVLKIAKHFSRSTISIYRTLRGEAIGRRRLAGRKHSLSDIDRATVRVNVPDSPEGWLALNPLDRAASALLAYENSIASALPSRTVSDAPLVTSDASLITSDWMKNVGFEIVDMNGETYLRSPLSKHAGGPPAYLWFHVNGGYDGWSIGFTPGEPSGPFDTQAEVRAVCAALFIPLLV